MYIANYPEDSSLRRHCDSAAALALQDWLAQGPSDAVLLRHWNQLRSAGVETAQRSPGTMADTAGLSRPAVRGGFFAWLGSLFRR